MRVLVIEDHATDRKLMGELLRMSGHVVHEAASAEDAILAILVDRPDFIVVDLRLPGSDGLALTRELKSSAGTRSIPILAVTAYPESYSRADLLSAGCEACIVKPIDTRALPKRLEEIALGRMMS